MNRAISRILAAATTTLLVCRTNESVAENNWYGWQPMLTDTGSVAATGAFSKLLDAPNPGFVLGITGYTLGSPIIHIVHGNYGRAGISLGVRVGAPIVLGVAVGGLVSRLRSPSQHHESNEGWGGFLVGAGIGMVGAMVFDYAVLSNESTTTPTPRMISFGSSF